MANEYDVRNAARAAGFSMKLVPTREGSELVLTRDNEGAPGEQELRFPVLGMGARAEEIISEINRKRR